MSLGEEFQVLTLNLSENHFTFSLPYDDYINDKYLIDLANSIGTIDSSPVLIRYTTDDIKATIKWHLKPISIMHDCFEGKEITTFVLEFIKKYC